jgi:hypothetical protein
LFSSHLQKNKTSWHGGQLFFLNLGFYKSLDQLFVYVKRFGVADALGVIYANAANNFMMEQAAMISNGG